MIELTEEQRREVRHADGPVRLTDPDTKAEYVVLKAEVYEQMRRVFEEVDPSLYEYDDGPWTDEEMDRLAEESGKMLDGDRLRP
ncbi:MAG TPA: hypothetical protein VGF55_03410 [Gemmataceae bacterium]|jgi:hypothetical protein